jgi:hypothetical protein
MAQAFRSSTGRYDAQTASNTRKAEAIGVT